MVYGTRSGEAFDITAAGTLHDAYRFAQPGDQPARARLLMFPDFDGAHTPGAARLADAYSHACHAEVILVDLYGKNHKPRGYDQRADSVINHARANPLEVRERLCEIKRKLEANWDSDAPLGAIGFCFGGSLAFELARADASLSAAFSVHGDPSTEQPLTAARSSTNFVIITGASDPFIADETLARFRFEADAARMQWQILLIGHARHSFTKREIGQGNWAMRYDAYADDLARSHVNTIITLSDRETYSKAPASYRILGG